MVKEAHLHMTFAHGLIRKNWANADYHWFILARLHMRYDCFAPLPLDFVLLDVLACMETVQYDKGSLQQCAFHLPVVNSLPCREILCPRNTWLCVPQWPSHWLKQWHGQRYHGRRTFKRNSQKLNCTRQSNVITAHQKTNYKEPEPRGRLSLGLIRSTRSHEMRLHWHLVVKCCNRPNAVPDERVSLLWENTDFHDLTKRWEGLPHQVVWKNQNRKHLATSAVRLEEAAHRTATCLRVLTGSLHSTRCSSEGWTDSPHRRTSVALSRLKGKTNGIIPV